MELELNLYLSSDALPFIILNCLNYSCIYVFLMVFQSSIVLLFSMLEPPIPHFIYQLSFSSLSFFLP
ncbi:hypothetical protein NC652_017359 [Populus alba x Populus x berolinensis]|uniref:Uncharacterized protein n=1 Tax=Populus alba x Populus x berolinensis TaxID=444605 RepID=A0AAD6QQ47_9ROSI|nr:hypothetical protein NC652_017359 [Populus alba x Populus x berolinensis]KAJ6994387.1 hypothetical protein NC653_017267 [Populus alba x Populus x berolinensis]